MNSGTNYKAKVSHILSTASEQLKRAVRVLIHDNKLHSPLQRIAWSSSFLNHWLIAAKLRGLSGNVECISESAEQSFDHRTT